MSETLDRPYSMTVFGVTGFTGKLVLKYLNLLQQNNRLPANLRLCFAGRHRKKLESLGRDLCPLLTPSYTEADISNELSIYKMVGETKVLLTCVVSLCH